MVREILFKKYYAWLEQKNKQVELVIGVVYQYAGVKLQPSELEIKNRQLFIKSQPAAKNEIFLKKSLILRELANTGIVLDDVV